MNDSFPCCFFLGAVVLYSNSKPEQKGDPSAAAHVTDVNMTTVAIPLASISQTATWCEYNVSGSTVRFFVVKDDNGMIHKHSMSAGCALMPIWDIGRTVP